MTKYKVVYAQNGGGWSVIATSQSGEEDKFYGFRDESHARDWVAKKLERKQQLGAVAGYGR